MTIGKPFSGQLREFADLMESVINNACSFEDFHLVRVTLVVGRCRAQGSQAPISAKFGEAESLVRDGSILLFA
jgi:hypothetical protein